MSAALVPSSLARWLRAPATLLAMAALVGCGDSAPPAATTAPATLPADPANTEVASSVALRDTGELIAEANAALAKDRMFSPPGDNALELLLEIVAADPGHQRARAGLADILPFVLIGLEQRLATGDLQEVERLLGLFRTADPTHPAIGRLQSQLDAASELGRQEEARRVAAEAERERLRALALAAPAQPLPEPAPAAAASVEQPSSTAAAPPPAPTREVSPPSAPPVAVPAAAQPAVVAAPAELPPILAQFAPRYPTQAQRRRLEGLVEVEFTVAGNGSVSKVRVVRSEPPGVFDREAVGAMQRWRFEGAGQAVVGRRVFHFKMGEG